MNGVNTFEPRSDFPLLIEPAFFDGQTCQRIRYAMDGGVDDPAEIISDQITRRETVRRARSVDIESPLLELVETRIDGIRTAVERTLGQPLGEREGAGFLRYRPGGFYRPHRDRGDVAGWPAAARRVATVVIFLNGGTATSVGRDFAGGDLYLYPDAAPPIRISPETGLLVAFPAACLHEVGPITGGIRDVAVDWFYDRQTD
jgi:predicted 2-oxoglutarate/Fe(II)-dependent dioxygenase YbiX